MSVEANKAIIRTLYEKVFNEGHSAIVDVLFSPQFVDSSTPEQAAGSAGVKAYVEQVRNGFPDIYVSIEDMVAEHEKVAARTTWRGTHLGVYEGVEATGKRVERTMMQIFRVSDGKILEEWNEGAGLLL